MWTTGAPDDKNRPFSDMPGMAQMVGWSTYVYILHVLCCMHSQFVFLSSADAGTLKANRSSCLDVLTVHHVQYLPKQKVFPQPSLPLPFSLSLFCKFIVQGYCKFPLDGRSITEYPYSCPKDSHLQLEDTYIVNEHFVPFIRS